MTNCSVSLQDLPKTRFPLLWARTDEPGRLERVCQAFVGENTRRLFRKNPLEGLQVYEPGIGKWLVVLVEEQDPNTGQMIPHPIVKEYDAMLYVIDEKGIYILHNAHIGIEGVIPLLTQLCNDWLNGFHLDDADEMGPTILLTSHSDKLTPELTHLATRFDLKYPNEAELLELVEFICGKVHFDLSLETKANIAKAGKGLTEAEFLSAAIQTIVEDKEISVPKISSIKIAQISAGGNLEIKVPKFTLNDVGGLDNAKEILAMNAWLHAHQHEAHLVGVKPLSKIMLVGVSGSGKSLLAEATASALNLELAVFNVSATMSKWLGESEANMRAAFQQIAALAPIVLWTDEVGRDFSGGNHGGVTGDSGTTDRVHGTLLSGLQELDNGVFWIGAANSLAALPPEMLRSGRIDQLLFVGFPTKTEREDIFKIHLGEHRDDYDIEKLAKWTGLFTGAEIESLIKFVRFNIFGREHRKPTTEDIIRHVPHLKNRVWRLHREQILDMYRQARDEWQWASSEQEKEADHVFLADQQERKGTKTTAVSGTKKTPSMTELMGTR